VMDSVIRCAVMCFCVVATAAGAATDVVVASLNHSPKPFVNI
jgi:hypothetical protein